MMFGGQQAHSNTAGASARCVARPRPRRRAGHDAAPGEWSERWGREATSILLRRGAQFDGIFCGSDQIARGVADALREAGRLVPEEVGLVGVDNWEVMSEDCRPPLTTIDLNLTELGHIAATKLLRAIEGHPLEKGVQLLPCRLVTRRSTEMLLENAIRPRTPIA
jgi:LacI family transcriptional regulator